MHPRGKGINIHRMHRANASPLYVTIPGTCRPPVWLVLLTNSGTCDLDIKYSFAALMSWSSSMKRHIFQQ